MQNYTLQHFTTVICLAEYIKGYRNEENFLGYCQQCNKYDICWSCPPFDFDTNEYLLQYHFAYIIGTKIIFHPDFIQNNIGIDNVKNAAYQVIAEVRKKEDILLLGLEHSYPDSRAFFAGVCHFCKWENCTRRKNQAFRYPSKMRSSLEAFGFDMMKTTFQLLHIEMKWGSNNQLPEYLTLVSGILSKTELQELQNKVTNLFDEV